MELHERVLARLEGLIALAESATPGPWVAIDDGIWPVAPDAGWWIATETADRDAAFIAQFSPSNALHLLHYLQQRTIFAAMDHDDIEISSIAVALGLEEDR